MEGASCPEPLEQSVLDSSFAAQPVGCVIENVLRLGAVEESGY